MNIIMDLRIQRTKAAIKSAFLELRSKKSIEKITITELSKLANINKATFYLHYSDIYDLSDEIEDKLLDEIIADGLDRFFEAPQQYSLEIFRTFIDNRKKLRTVFSGSRSSLFSTKIEQRIKTLLYEKYPELRTRHNDVVLSFLTQGMFHTVTGCREEDTGKLYEEISQLIPLLVNQLKYPEKN